MKFSLILATKDRTSEVEEFLTSLKDQRYKNFQVIIIDQNKDGRLNPVVKTFKKNYEIIHLRSDPGLSKARNVGLRKATGNVISFPDDDCKYPRDLLTDVVKAFSSMPDIDGLSGHTVDSSGRETAGRFGKKEEYVSKNNIWNSFNSASLFLQSSLIKKVGFFDESMGLGAFFSSAEETDYVIRALKKGLKLLYIPEINVLHPSTEEDKSIGELRVRGVNYGRGVGKLLKKHGDYFKKIDFLKVFFGPLVRSFSSEPKKRALYINTFIGRIEGYIKS